MGYTVLRVEVIGCPFTFMFGVTLQLCVGGLFDFVFSIFYYYVQPLLHLVTWRECDDHPPFTLVVKPFVFGTWSYKYRRDKY